MEAHGFVVVIGILWMTAHYLNCCVQSFVQMKTNIFFRLTLIKTTWQRVNDCVSPSVSSFM